MKQERAIDLDDEQYRTLKHIIENHIPNKEVWAYGSRVKWKASIGADLDLVVFDCDFSTVAAFREALEESDLVISVDVMNWEKIPDDFKENIKKKYVVVHKKLLPAGWQSVNLQSVAQINPLEKIKKNEIVKNIDMDKIIPFTKRPYDYSLKPYKGGARFRNGDTLLAKITPYLENGKTIYIDILDENEIGSGSTEFIVLREINGITDKQYLYYLAISPKFRDCAIKSMTGTSGRQRVETDEIKNYKFYLPSLSEQKTIAEILGGLDDKIDLLRHQNKTLKTIAQAFFREHIINNPRRENWKNINFIEIYDFFKGCEPGSIHYQDIKSDKNIRFIRVRDMLENTGNIYILKKYADRTCEKTDLLMSFDGTIGKVTHGIEGAYSSGIRKIVSLSDIYNNLGLKYLLFTNKYIQNILQQHAIGTVILHASGAIQYLNFRLPDEEKLSDFNRIITPIFDKIIHNQEQTHALEKLRDRLLTKIMSGKIQIKQ